MYAWWERELSGIRVERDIEDRKQDNNHNGNLCSAGIRHGVALMAPFHHCSSDNVVHAQGPK